MTTNTIKKVLAEHGLTPETQSLDVLIFDEVNGTRISVIDLLEEVDEAARAAEQADMAKRNEIHEKYHELNDKDIESKARSEGYKQGQNDAAKRALPEKLEKALSEYLDLLKQDKKLFPLTLGGEDEPMPTKYMWLWMANNIKLQLSEGNLRKIFAEYEKHEVD